MSWASYGDQFTRQQLWDEVSYEARWHYLALVEECVRGHRWDGRLSLSLACRASDVPDPEKCHAELKRVSMLAIVADLVELPYIGHHIPPPGQRPDVLLPRKRDNQAEYRRRKCERGDHDRHCPSGTCPVKLAKRSRVTARVSGNPESSRDETSSTSTTGDLNVRDYSNDGDADVEGAHGSKRDTQRDNDEPWRECEHGHPITSCSVCWNRRGAPTP